MLSNPDPPPDWCSIIIVCNEFLHSVWKRWPHSTTRRKLIFFGFLRMTSYVTILCAKSIPHPTPIKRGFQVLPSELPREADIPGRNDLI